MSSQAEFDVALGRSIRNRRVTMGLTQKQLGTGLGVTAQMVTKYEDGSNAVSSYRLTRIAAVLKTTAVDLLKDDKQPKLDKRTTAMIAFMEVYSTLTVSKQEIVRMLVYALGKL